MAKLRPIRLKFIAILALAATAGAVIFLLLLKVEDEVTNTKFCGSTCHVMKPQRVAHQLSPHAKVNCGTCHVGPGVAHIVQAKIEAAREVWSFVTKSYPKPIVSPVQHLRPARFTCEQCHWPEKYYGDKKITKVHYGDDPANSRQWVDLIMKTGGAGTTSRTGRGIHWHIEQELDYAFADDKRLSIPWVRMRHDGEETIFRQVGFADADKVAAQLNHTRRMDCMDCHNRATHILRGPDGWLDDGFESGLLPVDLPYLKKQASVALNTVFASRALAQESLQKIPLFYKSNLPQVYQKRSAEIDGLPQKLLVSVFDKTQFPEMKTDWHSNPNHLGHTQGGPGCFRCHDGNHVSAEGTVISQDCTLCHSRPAFGTGQEPQEKMQEVLLKGETHQAQACATCHNHLPSSDAFGLRSMQPPKSACYSCHDEFAHPAAAPMAKLACGECHKLHLGSPQNGSCLTCHEGVEQKGMHAHHLEMELACTKCHENHKWKADSATFDKTCIGCHEGKDATLIGKFLTTKK
jgi:hypothetical protein